MTLREEIKEILKMDCSVDYPEFPTEDILQAFLKHLPEKKEILTHMLDWRYNEYKGWNSYRNEIEGKLK